MKKVTERSFVRFCLVGGLGFVINFALLTLLYRDLHLQLFVAQLIAGEIALFNNFLLHHHWTYRDYGVKKTLPHLIVQFHVTSWLAIIGTAVVVNTAVNYLHIHYAVALVVGGIAALGWNYVWTRFVIWRKQESTTVPELVS